jgi:hypothetical protein
MGVVVSVTWAYVPMFVPMLIGAFPVMASVAPVAACDCCSRHHYRNAGNGFVVHNLRDLPCGIAVGLTQEHTTNHGYVDRVREPA